MNITTNPKKMIIAIDAPGPDGLIAIVVAIFVFARIKGKFHAQAVTLGAGEER